MTESSYCKQCDAPLATGVSACPRCGQTPLPQAGQSVFDWTDGQGARWRIEATPEELVLDGADRRLALTREEWRTALSFSQVGLNVVIHIDAGDREIGFMVPMAAAHALFSSMGRRAVEPTSAGPSASARPTVTPTRVRSPMWPKMTALPIVALFASVLAFIPMVGIAFGLVAFVCATVALRRSRGNAAHHHIRIMARISMGIAAAGLAVCALGTYSLSLREVEEIDLLRRLWGEEVAWSLGAKIAAVFMILIALSVHEASHALSAWWCGDDYARSLGRVTLNPLSHIDPFGTLLLPALLAFAGQAPFGYARPVPVQLGNVPRYRRAHILISAAGPASNLLQAAVCMGLLFLIGLLLGFAPETVVVNNFSSIQPIVEIKGLAGGNVLAAVAMMLKLGFRINLLLAFFNMLPVPPLDGSWIAEHMSPRAIGRIFAMIRPYGFFIFIILWRSGALSYLLAPYATVEFAGLSLLATVTGL